MPEHGDEVEVTRGGKTYRGVLMPRSELADDDHIVIKMATGYNVGVKKEGATINVISEKKEVEPVERTVKKKGNPKVTILGTGGTIASKIDYKTGAVHPSFSTEDLVSAVPELLDIADLDTKVLFNILSENMTPTHWVAMAEECAAILNTDTAGVVVAHGTDTMGYSAAALSFMLDNITKPVVFVGSQRSSDRPSSDSSQNLIAAVKIATSDLAGVVAVMHGSSSDSACLIHHGTRVRKMHTSRRDAFKSINAEPIGSVGDEVVFTGDHDTRSDGVVQVNPKIKKRVAFIKIHPGINDKLFESLLDNYKGIVIEGTGLGHVPEDLLPGIGEAQNREIPVVMTSQTLGGRIDMKVYSTGRELIKRGVISGEDMLPETAFVKLMHVLGQTEDYNEVRRLMGTNLRGEMSERSIYYD